MDTWYRSHYIACLRGSKVKTRPNDGMLVIHFDDDTVRLLCDNDEFKKEFSSVLKDYCGRDVEYVIEGSV